MIVVFLTSIYGYDYIGLTQNSAYLISEHRVCVVQPPSTRQALFKPAQDGLVTQQHHQDQESCRHRARVNVFFHKHQQPIKTQGAHKLITCPVGDSRKENFRGRVINMEAKLTNICFNVLCQQD